MFKRYRRFLFWFWGVFFSIVLACFVLFHFISTGALGFMPSFDELENPRNRFATEIYFQDGPIVGRYYLGNENRIYAEYRNIPLSVKEALICTEDVRFYEHSGIDVRGLGRVVWGMLTRNSSAGGGSTITQQLAKMLFPREEGMSGLKLVLRKFREWIIAVRLEKSYTKEEILAMYLNKFDFLNLAVGINSAAGIYFGSPLDSLRKEEAAMLVGMAKNPSLFNPLSRSEQTLKRRNVVLGQMYKYGKLEKRELDSLSRLPLGIRYKKVGHKEGYATYFREFLRGYMTASPPDPRNYKKNRLKYVADSTNWVDDPLCGWTNKNFKSDGTPYNIYVDGLKIRTTLDSRMQKYAEEAVVEHLSGDVQKKFNAEKTAKKHPPFSDDLSEEEVNRILEQAMKRSQRYRTMKNAGISHSDILKSFTSPVNMSVFTWKGLRDTLMSPMDSILHYKTFFRAGFMVMEPHSGEVKAYVGGPDYRYFMYDMVSMGKRQIGSTIKPILYTLAMQEGFSPDEKVPNVPQMFTLPNGDVWSARSGEKKAGEMVSLRWGLANSENNISAWVLKQFTPEAVAVMARKMGITAYIDPVPSVFLGTSEVILKELVAAYAIYANKGVYNRPLLVSSIEDRYGNVIAEFHADSREVITERTAYLMTRLLESVVNEGTGIRLRYKYKFENPIGGKTGTTQQHSDGWFIGITPGLVGGVWVGAEDRSIHFQTLANGQGASMALPIWALFFQKVYADKTLDVDRGEFTPPVGMSQEAISNEGKETEIRPDRWTEEDDEIFY